MKIGAEEHLAEVAELAGIEIEESHQLPSRSATMSDPPNNLCAPAIKIMKDLYPDGLFTHQAKAIEHFINDQDVCLATSTASGKSLVFQASAINLLLEDPASTVLALYPSKALIRDQLEKWQQVLHRVELEPCFIDGSIRTDMRKQLIASHRVVLMTPDVCHAWMMSNLVDSEVSDFLSSLRMVILDEAHVYDGVFGTNMAYFLRRLEAASRCYRMICSTATIGEPMAFMKQLTGREFFCLTPQDDCSGIPEKSILLSTFAEFDKKARFLTTLAESGQGSFIAFAESRKEVEQMVAACSRELSSSSTSDQSVELGSTQSIKPYRAGYEDSDRAEIQASLSSGSLQGVVSTSALELGLDIGEIRFVILLGTPISVKSFLQRIGRCGRSAPGACLVIDDRGPISILGLASYLERSVEPNWLYLENRAIQYVNVLCSAREYAAAGEQYLSRFPFASLPESTVFSDLLENELNPVEPVPNDLFQLKQRGEDNPHYEFPLRSAIERNFHVLNSYGNHQLGNVTFPQLIREAYPGALYYYMAQPYRVSRIRFRDGEIRVKKERFWTTEPITQTKIFPSLPNGIRSIHTFRNDFLAETELQVSERVMGFYERRGGSEPIRNEYGPGSPYSQREVNRFFESIGVCWYFEKAKTRFETLEQIREAFCLMFGIVERDLGIGEFYSRWSPNGDRETRGACIYDSAQGGLRLSSRLAEHFLEVVEFAWDLASDRDCPNLNVLSDLENIEESATALTTVAMSHTAHSPQRSSEWLEVLAPGSIALYRTSHGTQNVKVLGYHPGFQGLMYELEHSDYTWKVPAHTIQQIFGESETVLLNVETGEERNL
jgi:DEAD/DEAH box helicase domain-containing protein